jgi:hypothetical protein
VDDGPTVGLVSGSFDRPNATELKPVAHSYVGSRPKWWKHPKDAIA